MSAAAARCCCFRATHLPFCAAYPGQLAFSIVSSHFKATVSRYHSRFSGQHDSDFANFDQGFVHFWNLQKWQFQWTMKCPVGPGPVGFPFRMKLPQLQIPVVQNVCGTISLALVSARSGQNPLRHPCSTSFTIGVDAFLPLPGKNSSERDVPVPYLRATHFGWGQAEFAFLFFGYSSSSFLRLHSVFVFSAQVVSAMASAASEASEGAIR